MLKHHIKSILLSMLILLLSVTGVLFGLSEVNRYNESEVHLKTGNLSFSLINYQITHQLNQKNEEVIISTSKTKRDFLKDNTLYLQNIVPMEMVKIDFMLENTGSTIFMAYINNNDIIKEDKYDECFEVDFINQDGIEQTEFKIEKLNPGEKYYFSLIIVLKEEVGNEIQNEEVAIKVQLNAVQIVE